ncbi:putative type III restriction-modification system HindVIP enzyme mod [uncultured Paludibacter sp.]|nr:putative type III restriction-modification system HindVIP enzyme mod [uncultured Paludibacter sp.]
MKLYETLEQQLKKEPNFVTDNGELKKWVVLNKAQNFDEELIGLLLDNADLKEKFFVNVKGTLVFNQNLFVQFMEQKNYLNDSYTQYKNKVGLTIDGKYLKQRNEVALVWPFKDCILEGGQSREEDKREEIFFNEILAQDEITQLLEPKVLTNAKRIDKDGEKPLDQFNRNEKGTITDNLIIKGNNLLALHTLKEEFAGKVKLIYIDPPYNTGSDSFKYNDTFTESTWLTFMHNRLKAAHSLLDKSGVLLVQINDHNQTYLKILLDEVFKKENFINIISIRTKSPSGFKTVNLGLFETAEYILMYGKSKNDFKYNPQYVDSGYDENYTGYISNITEDPENWIIDDIRKIICREEGIDPDTTHQPYSKVKEKIGEGLYFQKLSDLALANANSVFRLTAIGDDAGKETLDAKKKSHKNPEKVLVVSREQNDSRYILNGQEIAFYSKKIKEIDGKKIPTTILTNIWSDIAYEGIASEGGVTLKKGKKPEKLLRRIIEMSTNENDLVLDYHLGSGTTAAVAHKLKRQYIGLEQLNYGENDSVKRLNNVINGDTTGISKSVNWQGGGSLVYLELKKYNQNFIEQIEEAKDSKALLKVWEQMKAKSFLNYNVDIKKQDENLEEFKTFTLAEQKQHLCELLDKNQLYVNLSSLNDADFACTEEEKSLNHDFYRIKR